MEEITKSIETMITSTSQINDHMEEIHDITAADRKKQNRTLISEYV